MRHTVNGSIVSAPSRVAHGVVGRPFSPPTRSKRDLREVVARLPSAARQIAGALSVGSGIALLVAPCATARVYGLPVKPKLGRALGARDVFIGLGLCIDSRWLRWWWLARTVSDALDVGWMVRQRVRRHGASLDARTAIGFALVGIDAAMLGAARADGKHGPPSRARVPAGAKVW